MQAENIIYMFKILQNVVKVKEIHVEICIGDIMKNEIIKELQYFKGVEFHEEQHFYTLNDYKFGISATSLIETYGQEFDSDSVSQMVANKRGIS